jgi:hypothetical protein
MKNNRFELSDWYEMVNVRVNAKDIPMKAPLAGRLEDITNRANQILEEILVKMSKGIE